MGTRTMFYKKTIYILLVILTFNYSAVMAESEVVEVQLYLKDHQFNPSVIELPANRKIIIILHNQDPTIEEFESLDLKREKIVLGNSFIKIILAPLKPGEYRFFGEFHEETAQGKIIVNGGE